MMMALKRDLAAVGLRIGAVLKVRVEGQWGEMGWRGLKVSRFGDGSRVETIRAVWCGWQTKRRRIWVGSRVWA